MKARHELMRKKIARSLGTRTHMQSANRKERIKSGGPTTISSTRGCESHTEEKRLRLPEPEAADMGDKGDMTPGAASAKKDLDLLLLWLSGWRCWSPSDTSATLPLLLQL